MTELTQETRQLFATQQVQKTLDILGKELRSNIMTIVTKGKTSQEREAKKKMLLKLVTRSKIKNRFYNFLNYRTRKIARPVQNTGKDIYNKYVLIYNIVHFLKKEKKEKWQPKYETIEYVDYNKNLKLILSTEPNTLKTKIGEMDKQIKQIDHQITKIIQNQIPELQTEFDSARTNYITAYENLIGKDPTLDKTLWQRIRYLPGQYDITKFPGDATFSEQYRDPLQEPFEDIIGKLTGVKYCLKLLVGSSGGSEYKKGFMGLVLWLIKNKGKPIPEEPEYEPSSSSPPEAAIVPFKKQTYLKKYNPFYRKKKRSFCETYMEELGFNELTGIHRYNCAKQIEILLEEK